MGEPVRRHPVRATPCGPKGTVQVRYTLKRVASQVRAVREALSGLAKERKFSPQAVREVTLALGEALDNALEYGCPKGGTVQVTLALDEGSIRVTVEDPGGCEPALDTKSFNAQSATVSGADSVRGRGLYLIRTVMDAVEIISLPGGGTRVVMTKHR
ncbi:MAG: ATP-binding protein [Planctomycetota bacterium]